MRRPIGWMLLLVGALLVSVGIGRAVTEFGEIYGGASADPMATPEVDEQARAQRMFRAAVFGAAGVVPLVIGTVLVKGKRRGRG